MLPYLIPVGIASVLGVVASRFLVPGSSGNGAAVARKKTGVSIEVVNHTILEEEPVVLATEEVPLDNRFGNKLLYSEHEFARTASVSLRVEQGRKNSASMRSTLWKLLESQTEGAISNTLDAKVGSQISRRVRLKFSTDPGCLVRYQVVWQQTARRGVLTLAVGSRLVEVPYMVSYGLFHSVRSTPGEGTPNSHCGRVDDEAVTE